jgi:pimeloyl-ACP methyl ester carboxylesterase
VAELTIHIGSDGARASRLPSARFIVAVTALVLASLPAGGCVHRAEPRPSGSVDVGGHRLSYRCEGSGEPVVVMDNGLGETMAMWEEVVPGVEQFTTVCVYDRAGVGASEAGPLPRTSQRAAEDLHALLSRARIEPPYVLVGHSIGGLNVRLFASEHPRDTAGLVLVDATHEDFPARERELRSLTQRSMQSLSYRRGPPAVRSEYEAIPQSVEEVRRSRPLPDVPVIVITAERGYDSAELKDAWMEMQRQLVQIVPHGLQIMATESTHNIQYDEPGLIVEAIHGLVQGVRDARTRNGAPPPR